MSVPSSVETLNRILLADDVSASLWSEIDSGRIDELVPELPALRMEQDPIHRHKDVLSHTVAVVAKTPADLIVRLAALFHDIAQPKTRRIQDRRQVREHPARLACHTAGHELTRTGIESDLARGEEERPRADTL